uniref:Uncharacterized protein n=1 Tax=Anopheles maculatus TaxID=74869 RepID=A0A182SLQ0_9DIPT
MAEHLMPSMVGSSLGRLFGMERRSVLGYESLSQTCTEDEDVRVGDETSEFLSRHGNSRRSRDNGDAGYLRRLFAPLLVGFGNKSSSLNFDSKSPIFDSKASIADSKAPIFDSKSYIVVF